MKLHKILIACIAVITLSGVVSTQGNNAAEARLRAAMDKETVDGDLKAAIDGYKQVISQRGASREVVAQALLRLGMAYEKQGSAEARKSYERIVREFGDQPAIAQQATARMADAVPSRGGPSVRQVCSDDCVGLISPDGKLLLSPGDPLGTSSLTVRDLVTGRIRRLEAGGTPLLGRFCCAHFSPDAKRIAFSIRRDAQSSEVVITNVDGTERRTVYPDGTPEDWSPDARRLLVTPRGGRPSRLIWVNVADGSTQVVPVSDGWENLDIFRVSPDGRYIAFSANRTADEKENVYLMEAGGKGETRLSPSPSYQEPAGWSPDGRYLLYWQVGPDARAGAVVRGQTLWAVPVTDGRVQGPPVKVRQFDDQTVGLSLSNKGTLYYRTVPNTGDPYTAAMDPATGKVTSVPAVLPTPSPGGPAAWSPDSRRLAYLTGTAQQREIHVFSLEDGKDQRVPARVGFVNSLCWLPGTESVLTNRDTGQQQNRYETLRVDLTTGETRPLFPGAPSFRLWNCTETTVANFDPAAVKVRSIATGAETELYRLKRPAGNYGMSKLSPDGRHVAFLESIDSDTSVLLTVPSGGGAARELARATAPARLQEIDGHTWSHDSRYVYFLKRANGTSPYRLYRVPVAGGAEEYAGLEGRELRGTEIAPDGRKIFFAIGSFNRPEIWALDNFLPAGR